MRKLKGEKYYALLCHCGAGGYWDIVICGVYASRKEAKEANIEVEKCHARHTIKKCNVTIEF